MIYSAYGIDVDSDFALAGLPQAVGKAPSAIRLDFASPDYVEADPDAELRECLFQGRRVLTWAGSEHVIDIDGVGIFRLKSAEKVICCRPAEEARDEVLSYWLLRYLIPLAIALQGEAMFFHGAAANIAGGAAAFLADSHGGKSTLAYYLQSQGHALVSDDDLLLSGQAPFLAMPSIPYIRTERVRDDLGIRVKKFDVLPTVLQKVYLLELSDAPAAISPLSGIEAATALLRQSRFLIVERLPERLRFCVRLASAICVSRLVVPQDLSRLAEVHEMLLADLGASI